MIQSLLPPVFVSHGAPTVMIEADSTGRAFLAGLGAAIDAVHGRPRAILAVTPHWETERATVGAAVSPETIHDFYGFPEVLYRLRYAAPGAPEVAERAAGLLAAAGIEAGLDHSRGFDHGTWAPLFLMYPEADVPVAQLSVQHHLGPRHHLALGRALAPLAREGVLILTSGAATHNLRQMLYGSAQVMPWAADFESWLVDKVEAVDVDALADYRTAHPEGARAHPRDEHFLPLFVALGAARELGLGAGHTLHRGIEHGSLSMAAFSFDPVTGEAAAA